MTPASTTPRAGAAIRPDVVPHPEEAVRRYRAAGWWTGERHADLLHRAARAFPDTVAVRDARRALDYRELAESARRAATYLAHRGIGVCDCVVVFMPGVVEYVEVLFGLFELGAVPVFALAAHREAELAHVLTHSGARAIVTVDRYSGVDHAGIAARAAASAAGETDVVVIGIGAPAAGEPPASAADTSAVPPPWHDLPPHPGEAGVTADDLAFLQLSGGTTGLPKLIPRNHDEYLYSVRESARICEVRRGDVMLVVLPPSHNFTMSSPGILGAIHAGATVVMAADPSPATCLAAIEAHRVTHVALVPPLLLAWLNSRELPRRDISSLRTVWVGGAKLSEETARRVRPELGCSLQQVFGMAEGLVNYTRPDDPDDVVLRSQGRPISPGDEVRVVDDADDDVPPGIPGALLTRGPYTIRGYYQAPEYDDTCFTGDGFYRTGDVVTRDRDGNLTVVGRSKDLVNRGGEKIAPAYVENHLLAHPAIHDASVVGVPDELYGERLRAHLILRDGIGGEGAAAAPTPAVLRRFLTDRGMARFMIPDEFRVVDAFPQTAVGKVSKRDQAAEPTSTETTPGQRPDPSTPNPNRGPHRE